MAEQTKDEKDSDKKKLTPAQKAKLAAVNKMKLEAIIAGRTINK